MTDPKADIADILDEGWSAEMFGNPASWSDAGGYLDKVLQDASRWAEKKISAPVYAEVGAGTYAMDCLIKCEVQYTNAVLFRRRIAFSDMSVQAGLQERGKYDPIKSANDNADAALERARFWLAEAQRDQGMPTEPTGTGVSSGFVQSGRFPIASGSTP